jgi:gamma-glutamyltranspeptidase/glutathione hydrolase
MWREIVERPPYHGYLPVLKGNVNDVGYRAIGVPSAVAGYAELHARFGGRWTWQDLIVPAIRYARDGVPVYGGVLGAGPPEWDWPGAVPFADRLAKTAAGRRRYLRGDRLFQVGEILRQPELARTLETLATEGPTAFYHGSIADRIARDMARHGGLVTAEDLAACRPAVTPPVAGQFGVWTIHAPPPPESGVSLLQVLAVLDDTLERAEGPFGRYNVRKLATALEFAAGQRGRYLSDPSFVDVPVAAMLAEAAARNRSLESGSGTGPSTPRSAAGRDTTSVVVADERGLVIAMNHSLVSHGGSGVVTQGLGFLYNNTMAGFDVEPGGRNSIEPGRARWSAACPTIATAADGSLRLAITGPGGSRAIGAVAQGVLNILAFGMDPLHAVSLPRIDAHDGGVDLEGAVPWSVEADLASAGIRVNRTYESGFGALYALGRDGDQLQAAADPRRTGTAIAT